MIMIGFLAFLDPPKPTTQSAIKALQEYGVTLKILTGDNDKVTISLAKHVVLEVSEVLLGSDIEEMTDEQIAIKAENITVFAKLSLDQKIKVVSDLRSNVNSVGYKGDGINDAAAMKASDLGISVDTTVDIAKEFADVILLKKDLNVLKDGTSKAEKLM